MPTVGMLYYRKDPDKLFRTYAYAAAAKMEGVDFFYFTPGRVNLEKEEISGLFYENGEWIERIVPYPDIIYNAGAPQTERQEEIYDSLLEKVTHTSHPIGNKMAVAKRIQKGEEFAQYLIPTKELVDTNSVMEALQKYGKIILKPFAGHKGIGIVFLEKITKKQSKVTGSEFEDVLQEDKLTELLDEIINEGKKYMIQPFIECRTKAGLAYDFRLHVQKNGKGEWVLTTIYPRIAYNKERIVPNLYSGGYSADFEIFLKNEFGEEHYNVKRYLEQFALLFANHFDNLYDEPLDELGIDVGLDENSRIWLFEVNWRPGTPALFHTEMDIAKYMMQYVKFLAEKYQ